MLQRLATWMIAEGDRSPDRIRDRLRATPTPIELIIVGSMVVILIASMGYPGHGIDWEIFAGAADGDFTSEYGLGYYYAYWLLPLFDLFSIPGVLVGGLIWSLTNLAGVWFAARVFGARSAVVLGSFGAIIGFYTGTITGLAIAAIAGVWWAVHEQRWTLAGALSLIALAKPQWGIPFAGFIVISARPPLVAWLKMALVPIPVVGLSFVAYGWWPGELLDRAAANPPVGNGSVWYFIGPVVLLLWAAVLLPMDAERRLKLVVVLSLIAMPYVQQYDYLVIWVLTADGLGLLSYAHGPLFQIFGWEGARAFQTVMPLTAYALLVSQPLADTVRGAWGRRTTAPSTGVEQTA